MEMYVGIYSCALIITQAATEQDSPGGQYTCLIQWHDSHHGLEKVGARFHYK